jgi:hypothetical protein
VIPSTIAGSSDGTGRWNTGRGVIVTAVNIKATGIHAAA